ncbi:hypothetical protein EHEL_090060 [Encephalitozoon hellem ATCC 50504]|uniref:CTD kinase subunit gamma n=1 Tax=Encephalitozoon hellem TaxID=27973 RepID=A0A9Q9F8Q2_ENCHE|nr:uncharacterized protein EHEL_090060 [Encephalitozoon hellem ATCC 50504]AFM98902.1 hypothetical protein EHEL_090060 [Encephalitozoon hellem ATCC 50504]UTX43914.1 CTD kinase subunit gamma [Encephalitozoon hellem]|eukprot:XP_003887883.1 hypothetical protein EHEL_090060 [Encephalitozoon hellem ATCC 50504]
MNQDMVIKIMPFLAKKSILALHYITGDPKYPIYVINEYKSRLNTISLEKITALVQKAIDIERNDLAMEYLCHLSPGRMARILFRIAENTEPEKTSHVISSLKRSHSCLLCSMNNRCSEVITRLEGIVRNIKSYTYYCK